MIASNLNVKKHQDWNTALPLIEQYYSVEFSLEGLHYLHQFRILNLAKSSMCVLVREGSDILGFLKVGDIIKMKYYRRDMFQSADLLDTEIQHISKEDQGRYRGHYIIGLSILTPDSDQNLN